jgi:hypothetical protein
METTKRNILLASLLTVGLYFLPRPWGEYLTYPLRLLITFFHEGSHALATILTGGSVAGLGVSSDGSGLTLSSGGVGWIVSSAGYLGTTLLGAALLRLLQKGADPRRLLLITGIGVALMSLSCVAGMFHLLKGSVFGLIWAAILAPALILAGRKLSKETAGFLAGLIGVQCVLNAILDLKNLFMLSALTNVHTDAQNMERYTAIPAVFWSVLWIVMALGILWVVLIAPALKKSTIK